MGFFDFLKSEEKELSPLERERQDAVQDAKNEIYKRCFSELERMVPRRYKNNMKDYHAYVNPQDISVQLDKDTIHKVLTKATYDAMKKIGLNISNKPWIKYQNETGSWMIMVQW